MTTLQILSGRTPSAPLSSVSLRKLCVGMISFCVKLALSPGAMVQQSHPAGIRLFPEVLFFGTNFQARSHDLWYTPSQYRLLPSRRAIEANSVLYTVFREAKMNAAWLTYPLAFTGMRMFECGDFSDEECAYYKERWHFWFVFFISIDLLSHRYPGTLLITFSHYRQWHSSCAWLVSSSSDILFLHFVCGLGYTKRQEFGLGW